MNMNSRQQAQQNFDASDENLIVGQEQDCPISVQALADINEHSVHVVDVIRSGLTAEVFHLRIDGQDYNLKKRRMQAKVNNLDGQFSFLNEVQRRHDLQALKQHPQAQRRFTHIVPTIYANYRLGIILSPWIEGGHIQQLTSELVDQLFDTLQACEEHGLMEWDLCSGNLLVDKEQQIWLFDFGYMYPYEPKQDFKSNGLSDPIFHMVERFETRFFFGWLLGQSLSVAQQLELYFMLKTRAIRVYQNKLQWLKKHSADFAVIEHFEKILSTWQWAIVNQSNLVSLFQLESFRSHVLDIEDDLEGKSCTPLTLKRIEAVQNVLATNFDYIAENGGLFYANADKTQQQLMAIYAEKRQLAEHHQVVL